MRENADMDPELTRRIADAINQRKEDAEKKTEILDVEWDMVNLTRTDGGLKRGEMVIMGPPLHHDGPKSMSIATHVAALMQQQRDRTMAYIDIEADMPSHLVPPSDEGMSVGSPLTIHRTQEATDAYLQQVLTAKPIDEAASPSEAIALKVEQQLKLMEDGLRMGHVPEEVDEEFFKSLGLQDDLLKADTLEGLQAVANKMRSFQNRIRSLDRQFPKVMGKTVFVKKRHSKTRNKGKRK